MMRTIGILLTLAAAAFGQNYVLKSVVIDAAGAPLQSANLRANLSAGQTAASNWLASTTFRAVLGFWHGQYSAGVTEEQSQPAARQLALAVSPNPLRGRAVIRYALPREADVSLQLIDNSGRRLGNLVGTRQPAGSYSVTWDFGSKRQVGAGVYFVRLTAAGASRTVRIVVAR